MQPHVEEDSADAELSRLAELSAVDITLPVEWDTAPYAVGQTLALTLGTALDGILSAEAEIVRIGDGEHPELALRVLGPLRRQQRRSDVRLVIDVPARRTLRLLPSGEHVVIRSRVLDISAGGLLLHTDREIKPGERLVVAFALPGDGQEMRVAVLVRFSRPQGERVKTWDLGCQFQVVRPADRERVARFIFAQQREAAQRRRALVA